MAFGDEALRERHRLLEKPGRTDFDAPRYSEREEYFVNRGRWTIGPRGHVYTAPDRDRYLVRIHDRQVRIACPGNPQRDRVPLADGWFALLRGLEAGSGDAAERTSEHEATAAQILVLRRA